MVDTRVDNKTEQNPFTSLLDDLGGRLRAYLSSDDKRSLDETSSHLMEKAFNLWESVFTEETSAEQIACEIAITNTDFFQINRDFMASVLAGEEAYQSANARSVFKHLVHIIIELPVSDEYLSKAWVLAHGLMVGLSRHKAIVELMLEKGLLQYHMKELRALRVTEPVNHWVGDEY